MWGRKFRVLVKKFKDIILYDAEQNMEHEMAAGVITGLMKIKLAYTIPKWSIESCSLLRAQVSLNGALPKP